MGIGSLIAWIHTNSERQIMNYVKQSALFLGLNFGIFRSCPSLLPGSLRRRLVPLSRLITIQPVSCSPALLRDAGFVRGTGVVWHACLGKSHTSDLRAQGKNNCPFA